MAMFELSKNDFGEYYFQFLDADDHIVLRSGSYSSKASAQNGIEAVRKYGGDDGRYVADTTAAGKLRFHLKTAGGQMLGSSPAYSSEQMRDAALQVLQQGAAHAGVVEDL